MKTVQESIFEAVIQFYLDHDEPAIQKENLDESMTNINFDKSVFNRLFRRYLEYIYDTLLDKLRQDFFATHSYCIPWDTEFNEPDITSDEWKKSWRDFYEWIETCKGSILPDIHEKVEFSYPQICNALERFDILFPRDYLVVKGWTEEQLEVLCEKLIEGGYVASDTRVDNFVALFLSDERPEGWQPIRWIKKSAPRGNKGIQLNKKALLELLELLSVRHRQIHDTKLLRSLFAQENGSPMIFKPANYQTLTKRGCCYNELKEIVSDLCSFA